MESTPNTPPPHPHLSSRHPLCSHVSLLVYSVKTLPNNGRVKRLTNSFFSSTATHRGTKDQGEKHTCTFMQQESNACALILHTTQRLQSASRPTEIATQTAHDTSCCAAQRTTKGSLKYESTQNVWSQCTVNVSLGQGTECCLHTQRMLSITRRGDFHKHICYVVTRDIISKTCSILKVFFAF